MKQPRPWLDEVIDAFQELGGDAPNPVLHNKIQERNVMNFTKRWKGTVEKAITRNSSDSNESKYTGNDIFYLVKYGHWGLRKEYL